MKEIIFATGNKNKLMELNSLVGDKFNFKTMKEIGFEGDIDEPYMTFAENAMKKAKCLYSYSGKPSIGEDSGLMVYALDGAPGVFSARYAGEDKDDSKNISKLLGELQSTTNRRAKFVTALAYVDEGVEKIFLGECPGEILNNPIGEYGFGYDPVFRPDGDRQSFAEMDMQTKNRFSHRAKAVRLFVNYLLDS